MSTISLDLETVGLTDIIRLQNQLSQVLKRRFERNLALTFTDVVGSTPYFAKFGDEAGRGLQQRHFDLLSQVLPPVGGRVVDTAGDGAFACFPGVEQAIAAVIQLQEMVTRDNAPRARDHQLLLRIGIHWGSVLTDGAMVTGDSVNLCARVCGAGSAGQVVLTRAAFQELPNLSRLRCQSLGAVELKGIPRPVELMNFEWRDTNLFPALVRVEESGEEIALPPIDIISFGRLRENDGMVANDVVLALADEKLGRLISRWHFELRRRSDGFMLKPVSDQLTELDGQAIPKGQEVPLRSGAVVRLGKAVRLTFLSRSGAEGASAGDSGTMFVKT